MASPSSKYTKQTHKHDTAGRLQTRCSADADYAMEKHCKQRMCELLGAKLILVSARNAPVIAINTLSNFPIMDSMVIVDSQKKESSKHNLGGEFVAMKWQKIPAKQGTTEFVVYISICTREMPKSKSTKEPKSGRCQVC